MNIGMKGKPTLVFSLLSPSGQIIAFHQVDMVDVANPENKVTAGDKITEELPTCSDRVPNDSYRYLVTYLCCKRSYKSSCTPRTIILTDFRVIFDQISASRQPDPPDSRNFFDEKIKIFDFQIFFSNSRVFLESLSFAGQKSKSKTMRHSRIGEFSATSPEKLLESVLIAPPYFTWPYTPKSASFSGVVTFCWSKSKPKTMRHSRIGEFSATSPEKLLESVLKASPHSA